MNKRGRFLGLGVVGTLALLASLIVASASAVAQNGDLPDFGDLNNVMPPPQMEATPEATGPADGPSGQDDGSEGNQDADPTQPVAPPAASPTAEEVGPPAPKSSLSTHVSGRDSSRGSCTMYNDLRNQCSHRVPLPRYAGGDVDSSKQRYSVGHLYHAQLWQRSYCALGLAELHVDTGTILDRFKLPERRRLSQR